jgi:hypothetical protein
MMTLQSIKRALIIAAIAGLTCNHNAHAARYSTASLRGTCIWLNVAIPTSSGARAGTGPATILSPITFDGHGHVTLQYRINLNGAYSFTPNVAGTYSVDPDGNGTLNYKSPATGQTISFNFFIALGGDEIRTIHSASAGKARTDWVTTGACTFK